MCSETVLQKSARPYLDIVLGLFFVAFPVRGGASELLLPKL